MHVTIFFFKFQSNNPSKTDHSENDQTYSKIKQFPYESASGEGLSDQEIGIREYNKGA